MNCTKKYVHIDKAAQQIAIISKKHCYFEKKIKKKIWDFRLWD